MKSLSSKTYQCGVTIQGLTTLSGTVYLTGITNTASWDHVIVGTTAQGQIYTRTYAQLMSDITSGIGLSGYVPTSRTLTINGVSYDLTANRSWTITTPYVSKLQHQVKAGVAINKGQAVYVTSADGTNMIVGLASNASEATSSKTMGLLDATVSTNGFANVVTEGLLDGLDTSTAGAAGDPVWLGTGGNLIYGLGSKPYAPAHLVFIGIVTRKNSNNGEIFVKVQNGFELKEIHDVDLITTAPVNGHILGFDGTLWVNKTVASWLGYTPASASGTTNYLSKFTGSTTLGNSQIFDNGTNVGIGNSSPSQKLDVSGYAKFTSGIILDGGATSHYREFIWNTSGFNRWDLYVYGAEPGSNVGGDLFLARYADNGAYLGNAVIFQRSTGNVGIGTTSPYSKLEITPSSVAWGEGIVINPASGYSAVFYRLEGAQGSNYTGTWAVGKAFSGDGGGELLQVVKNGLTGSAAYRVDASQQWKTNGDSIFGFNVGIGTTSPGNKLHIVGAANGSDAGNIRIDSTDQYGGLVINENTTFRTFLGYGNANHIFSNAQSDSTALRAANYLHLGASSVATITINASDNVGIGTTSPAYKLDVATGNDNAIRILNSSGSNNNGLALSVGSGTPWLDFYGGRFDIKYNTSPGSWNSGANTFLSILSSGNVGIGTTNPYEKLEVSGAISATGSVVGLSAQGHSTTLAVQSGISFLYAVDWGAEFKPLSVQAKTISLETGTGSTTSRLFIDNLGNVGIGTISPSYKLQVNADGAGLYVLGANTAPYTQTIASFVYGGNGNSINIENQGGKASIQARAGGSTMDLLLNPAGSNVGIGTTSPGAKLDVNGAQIIQSAAGFGTDADQAALFLSNTANFGLSGNFSGYSRNLIKSDGGSILTVGRWNTSLIGELSIESGSSGLIKFLAGASERMRISSAGNVGIGTDSPASKLDLYNGTDLGLGANGIRVQRPGAYGQYGYLEYLPSSDVTVLGSLYTGGGSSVFGQIYFRQHSSTTSRDIMVINSSGNVGIGTSSPSDKLQVQNGNLSLYSNSYGNTGLIRHFGTDSLEKYQQGLTTGGDFYQYTFSGLNHIFYTNNGNERMRITSGGNVGIGTNAPTSKLQVNGQFRQLYSRAFIANPLDTDGYAGHIIVNSNNANGDLAGISLYTNSSYNAAAGLFALQESSTAASMVFYTGSNFGTEKMRITSGGNVGIGTTTPATLLDVSGVITATGGNSTNWNTAYGWGNHASANYVPQARTLTINGTTYDLSANRSWTIATTTPGGSDTQVQYNSSGSLAGASALTYNSTTNRVGINQAFPGYDLDVNGQVRVQDKLRVGTGNGVVHMSSTATINPSATTVVWAQTVSVGMCAFIEYYILNNNSLTDQRAGTIMVTWNQSGTPTIAHTETTTPDIGSTTTVNFTSSLVGSDARINAVNSSANPYTMVMSFKYF
jgi:hypothetical protein